MARFNSYDYAFLLGLLCGADCMKKELQHEMEETYELYKTEMWCEAETFNQFVRLKNRAHELAAMLWAAIKTIRDRDTRIGVMNEVRAGFDRLEASNNASKAKR
jgi:hypothetical protein